MTLAEIESNVIKVEDIIRNVWNYSKDDPHADQFEEALDLCYEAIEELERIGNQLREIGRE